jgi:hypothetical protein
MIHCYIGNIGNYTDPLLYLYNKDLEHPSSKLCKCGRHLNISGSTSSMPERFYYAEVCIYHTRGIFHYKIGSKEYELKRELN